jgi:hypothetical protein
MTTGATGPLPIRRADTTYSIVSVWKRARDALRLLILTTPRCVPLGNGRSDGCEQPLVLLAGGAGLGHSDARALEGGALDAGWRVATRKPA